MTTKITAPPYHVADRMVLASVDVLDVTNTPVARCYANRHGTNGAFAQARLFAAAPELLDALKAMTTLTKQRGDWPKKGPMVVVLAAADAAILKAEAGEEALAEMKQGRR